MSKQKGNALWFILVAIALMGLLTVMMSRSSSTSNETGGYEQHLIQANEILSYAKNVENAVQGLLARGCSENDLSFWHDSDSNGIEDVSDDYYNANSPTDHSCHVFDVVGAGLTWITLSEEWLDPSMSAGFNYGDPVFSSVGRVVNLLDSSKDELLILMSWVPMSLCQALNKVIVNDTDIPEDPASFGRNPAASGAYDITAAGMDFRLFPVFDGAPTACFSSAREGGYHFYHALHAR